VTGTYTTNHNYCQFWCDRCSTASS